MISLLTIKIFLTNIKKDITLIIVIYVLFYMNYYRFKSPRRKKLQIKFILSPSNRLALPGYVFLSLETIYIG
ncbi:hypothetical protein PAECIP111802_05278 [Paenibacillus allorhizosphaerae]|uniref:Uncharacterized protein n=1 Tax=Paenibacillus allorhizosphaerae TaxID=2849866 RepID=A0ABM8VP99_9BACL|nr:hypothetical protein PAECIP111802_05278 [Paenibacillus allorhizosphaerae]